MKTKLRKLVKRIHETLKEWGAAASYAIHR